MNHIYVRAPGPGAIIRLMERFAGAEPWRISITPADVQTGYRCVSVTGYEASKFASHLAMSLADIVYVVDTSSGSLQVTKYSPVDSDGSCVVTSLISLQVSPIPILAAYQIKQALKRATLPVWVIKLKQLRPIPYETIAVLDQRDLLVEAGDVQYTSQGNIPD